MDHLVNADMHFGSLGFYLASQSPALVYCFPGSEGEHIYAEDEVNLLIRWRASRQMVVASTELKPQRIICLLKQPVSHIVGARNRIKPY